MKRKNYTLLLLLLLFTLTVSAQNNRAYFGLGASYLNFQDARFSNLRLSGNALSAEIGYESLSEKRYSYLKSIFSFGTNPIPFRDDENISIIQLSPALGYFRNFFEDNFYLGFTANIFDLTTRTNNVLSNSSLTFMHSNDLLLAAAYVKPVSKSLRLEFRSELGLLSIMKYAPSFSATFPQNIIDNGRVSYQDGEILNATSWKYMVIKTGFNQTYLKFNAAAYLGKRLGISYAWRVRSFSDFEDYPLTMARHSFTFRYHFISRSK